MTCDVFISYSTKDKVFANALRQHLLDQGVSCWINTEGIAAGEDWTEMIGRALRSVSLMVLLYSSNALESDNVKDEVALAAKRKLPIIPVRIEDIEPDEFFEVRMARISWLNVFERQQECLSETAASIKTRLEKLQQAIPQRQESVSESGATIPDNEKKYINALHIAYSDNSISNIERDKLNTLAMDLSLPPNRMKELEDHVKKEKGVDTTVSPLNASAAVNETGISPSGSANVAWPDVGINFLKAVLSSVDPLKLPFSPQVTSTENDIPDELEVDWYLNNKHYFCVWLPSKRLDKVHVQWGFYSENTSRDPLFRQTCNALYEMPDLLDKKGDVSVNNIKYIFESGDNYLGFEANERKSVAELTDNGYVQYVAGQLISFANAIWPAVEKNLMKG